MLLAGVTLPAYAAVDELGLLASETGPLLLLETAVDSALARNRKLDSAFRRTEQAQEKIDAVKTQQYPRLGIKAGVRDHLIDQHFTVDRGALGDYPVIGPLPGENVDITTNYGVVGFTEASIEQPLTQLYSAAIAVDHSEMQKLQSDADYSRTRQRTILNVKQAYYAILRTQADIRSARESVVFLKELSRVTHNYVTQGEAYDYEALEVDSRLAHATHNVKALSNRLIGEKQDLNHLMDVPLNRPFKVQMVVPSHRSLPNRDVIETAAIRNNASITEARYGVESARLALKAKESEYIPDVALTASYVRLYDVEFIPEEEAYVGIEMAWDIYDWGRKSSEASARKAEIYNAENRLQDTRNQVLLAVDRAYRQWYDARSLIAVTRLSETAAESKRDVQWNRYQQREALLDDVLKAQTALQRAKTEHYRAILGAYSAMASIENLVGDG